MLAGWLLAAAVGCCPPPLLLLLATLKQSITLPPLRCCYAAASLLLCSCYAYAFSYFVFRYDVEGGGGVCIGWRWGCNGFASLLAGCWMLCLLAAIALLSLIFCLGVMLKAVAVCSRLAVGGDLSLKKIKEKKVYYLLTLLLLYYSLYIVFESVLPFVIRSYDVFCAYFIRSYYVRNGFIRSYYVRNGFIRSYFLK